MNRFQSGFLPAVFAAGLLLFPLRTSSASELITARNALRAHDYPAAVEALAEPTTQQEWYLRALAYYHAKDYSAAEADAVRAADADDQGLTHKAVFLRAACLTAMKRHEDAAEIYDAEAARLLSAQRKAEISEIYTRIAEELSALPAPEDLDAPQPDYAKAADFYLKALDLELEPSLKMELEFRRARMVQLAGDPRGAVNLYRELLETWDPEWRERNGLGPMAEGMPSLPQKRATLVRYYLATALLDSGDRAGAQNLTREIIDSASGEIAAAALLLNLRSYNFPQPANPNDWALGLRDARMFLDRFPDHLKAVEVAFQIAQADLFISRNQPGGRIEEAIADLKAFLAKSEFSLNDEVPDRPESLLLALHAPQNSPVSSRQRFSELAPNAQFLLGQTYLQIKKYEESKEAFALYLRNYPNGPQWTQAQEGLLNIEFQRGLDQVAEKDYEGAIATWQAFLDAHPLDVRARRIMYLFGRIPYQQALEADEQDQESQPLYEEAIAKWEQLVSKYPGSDEASRAQFQIGDILETRLMRLKDALAAYRKLNWGPWAGQAQERIRIMSQKSLQLVSPRIYRTGETPSIDLAVRNIEKVKVKLYNLNLEEFFRKTHGIRDIDSLDLALIDPDKEWEVAFDGYREYLPIEQNVELTVDPGPGVWAVNVSEEEFQSTTIVIRSDLDVIIKASRKQVLVFAQNLKAQTPVEEAKILVSDGNKIFVESATNKDGVLLQSASELGSAGLVRVFASSDGHVASGTVDINGLGQSAGLSPKGFIFTDRPVYLPGGKVGIKGILRLVEEGSYQVDKDGAYNLSVTSPDGRVLFSRELTLNEFGTFTADLDLPADALEGPYNILVSAKDRPTYSGLFQVQRYELKKVRLDLEFDRNVYFPGEPIKGTFIAETYDGRPIADSRISYRLPDGRQLVDFTNANGRLEIEFPTDTYRPGQVLGFMGTLEQEGVSVQKAVTIPAFGFTLEISGVDDVVVVGEPLEADIQAKDPEGQRIEKTVEVTLLRRQRRPVSPILRDLPWPQPIEESEFAEIVVEKKTVQTSGTGPVSVRFVPQTGGNHWIRVEAKDRLDQMVQATAGTFVSDDEDNVRLRMFAEKTRVKVGDEVALRTIWREDPALCLMTYEGEEVFAYELVQLDQTSQPMNIKIGNEHFPNFTLSLAAMQGRELYQSQTSFDVERELNIKIKPEKEAFEPGATGKVGIEVTDQQGNPVSAELSLALVQQALLDLWPDPLQPINEFFQEGIRRDAALRTNASNGFAHHAVTKEIPKELLAEEARLKAAEAEERTRGVLAERMEMEGVQAMPQAATAAGVQLGALNAMDADFAPQEEAMQRADAFAGGYGMAAGGMGGMGGADGQMRFSRRAAGRAMAPTMGDGAHFFADQLSAFGTGMSATPRKEIPGQGFWIGRVKTDADGHADIEVEFPGETTLWKFKARGCTVETLVGEAEDSVQTRRELFVEVQTPTSLVVGDTVRLPLVAHNLGAQPVKGIVRVRLMDGDQELRSFSSQIEIAARAREKIVMAPFEAPDLRRVNVVSELLVDERPVDILEQNMPIRPWGMALTNYSSGSASASRTIFIERPGKTDNPARMNISIGDRVRTTIIDAALGRRPVLAERLPVPYYGYEQQANQLLACTAAIEYTSRASAMAAQVEQLRSTARGLVASLVAGQKENGLWPRTPDLPGRNDNEGDIRVSARVLWALATARDQGIMVDDNVVQRARNQIDQQFRGAQPAERELKAMLLWSLARSGEADFAHANRLYRERGQLTSSGLAYTALTLERLNRREMAGEVVDAIVPLLPSPDEPGLLPVERTPSSLWWSCGPAEVTALAALAMEAAKPEHPALDDLIQRLEGTRYGILPGAQGPVIAALARYYSAAEYEEADLELEISVNGHDVHKMKVTGSHPAAMVEVPSELLQNGKNRVDFSYAGRGKYSYAIALSGWTDDFPEEKPWGKPYPTNRRIYHAPLRYKGRPMGSSTQEVGQIQVGEVVRVSVWFENGQSWRPFVIREPLPAGCALVPDSLQANQEHVEMREGEMLITFKPNTQMHSFSYELVGAVPGTYKIAPTQMSDALDPSLVVCAERSNLEVLAPGESADYTYKMNCSEMWSFAEAYFSDNAFEESLDYLEQLKKECPGGYVPSKERLLVWILSRPEFYDADALVDAFEVLKEKQPDLWVPFEKMQMVGRAYRDKGEHERAALVLKATIEASFYRDSRGGGTLENEGRYLASWDYMDRLIAEYPNLNPVIDAEFGLTQLVYNRAQDPESLWDEIKTKAKPDEEYHLPNRIDILGWAVDRLREFRCMHPESPLGDDAAFSEASALLEIGQHERMVELVRLGRKIYPKDANYAEQFPYMEALGLFHQRAFEEAVKAAEEVAGSRNENRDLAVYILGQIYHAQEKPAEAVRYYDRVAGQFPDAAGALEYFKREELSLPEITILKPGEEVKLEVKSRNLKDARVLVYRVDLMTLYLREKNLARIAQVNLAGIDPQVGLDLELAEAVDYAEHKHEVALPLEEDGAFLVLVRSGDRFASGLVLVTPLSIEVQEDAVSGTVRVNVRDTEGYAEDVHVKAVGSADGQVRSGDTDLRGVVVIDGIRGNATIIARDKDRQYAFHRGEKWLGPRGDAQRAAEPAGIALGQEIDLASNLRKQVQMQVESNLGQQQSLYSNTIKGVQVQAAY